LLATNSYSDALAPNLAPKVTKSIVPLVSFQIATKPLSDELRQNIIPNREAISDTQGDLHYFRYDARNRMISGGAFVFKHNIEQRLKKHVGERFARAFPKMGVPEFSHIWSGYVGISMDRFPHFYKLGENYWGWSGCNGRGLALGVSLGREFALAIDGQSDIALPFEKPKPIAFYPIVKKLAPAALAYYRWKDKQQPKFRNSNE
jgi:glycine/D-amino acid oxidase-like deaminating enzyme